MGRTQTPHRLPILAVVLAPALLAAFAVAAFAWASARLAPHGLPLAVAGPKAALAAEQQLARDPGAFAVHYYTGEAQAVTAVRHREVYGALVITPRGATLLTAPPASPLVARLLTTTPPAGTRVVNVVSADPQDPQGIAFGASLLPLVLVGTVTGIILLTTVRTGPRRVIALLAAAALVGLVAIGITAGWLGIIPGNWGINAAVLALVVLAIAAGVAGLGALLGYPGVALGALLAVFVGNPFSGAPSAPELLPVPAGVIGQLLPPGAGQELLRSTAFFSGYGYRGHLAVLLTWAVAGLAAAWAGRAFPPHRPAPGPGDGAVAQPTPADGQRSTATV
jgi:hypothetical protein